MARTDAMKLHPLLSRGSLIALALVAFVAALPAATTNSAAAKPVTARSVATAPVVLLPPPPSVFVLPKKPAEGKDPFFPSATRVYTSDSATKPKDTIAPVGELSLKGISGTAVEPLAIINTTTFTVGEENEVITTTGRVRVRCIAINMTLGTAIVQVAGERRELRLQELQNLQNLPPKK